MAAYWFDIDFYLHFMKLKKNLFLCNVKLKFIVSYQVLLVPYVVLKHNLTVSMFGFDAPAL